MNIFRRVLGRKDTLPGRWDLSCLYSGDDDPQIQRDIAQIEAFVNAFAAKYADLTADASFDRLAEALDEFRDLQHLFLAESTIDQQLGGSKPEYYWMLRQASATTSAVQAEVERLATWRQAQLQKLEFFFQLFATASHERRDAMLGAAELRRYKFWLVQRFMLPVATPTPQAKAAAAAATAKASHLTDQLSAAIGSASAQVWKDGKKQTVTLPGINSLTTSPIPAERWSAAAVLPDLLAPLRDQAFEELTAALAARVAEAGLQGGDVETVRCAADTLSPDTLDSLLDAITGPEGQAAGQRYYQLKAALMGVQQLPFAWRRLPSGALQKRRWTEVVGLVRTFYERIKPSYADEFDRALKRGHIDAEPRKGKTPVTACWWMYGHPPFLAVNFTGDWNNLSQVLHEFGHDLAGLLDSREQDGLGFNTRVPLAETHGVTLQLLAPLVLSDMLSLSDQDKLTMIMAQLETLTSTVLLQGNATAFERQLYAEFLQGTLTVDRLETLFTQHMARQFGPAVAMDSLARLYWIIWVQLRYGFYNYAYSFAGIIAAVLCDRFTTDPDSTIAQINTLLGAGSSGTLADIFEGVGITLGPDLWREGIHAITALTNKATILARQLGYNVPAA